MFDLFNPVNWVVIAVLLVAAEIVLPSTIALGFGLGALLVAALLWLVAPEGLGVLTLTAIWVVASGVAWVVMRVIFRNRASKDDPYDGDINEY